MIDITGPEHVEIIVRSDRKVVWVNVDGVCQLRCSQIVKSIVNDNRRSYKEATTLTLPDAEKVDQQCPYCGFIRYCECDRVQ